MELQLLRTGEVQGNSERLLLKIVKTGETLGGEIFCDKNFLDKEFPNQSVLDAELFFKKGD